MKLLVQTNTINYLDILQYNGAGFEKVARVNTLEEAETYKETHPGTIPSSGSITEQWVELNGAKFPIQTNTITEQWIELNGAKFPVQTNTINYLDILQYNGAGFEKVARVNTLEEAEAYKETHLGTFPSAGSITELWVELECNGDTIKDCIF